MADRVARLLSPDGQITVTIKPAEGGGTMATYTWQGSGQDDTLDPSPRDFDDLRQFFVSYGWTVIEEGASDA